jgi:hypothetical protein
MSRTSLCREISKVTQAWGSTKATCHGDVADKECTCFASSVMRERYPPSPDLFCARVPKPKQSRRTVVDRVTSGCESRRNRAHVFYLGHEEDINPLGLEPRDTRGSTGVPDHFSQVSKQ